MKARLFAYRVYFTLNPRAYYVVSARNAKDAVKRAKQSFRAFVSVRKRRKLEVHKIERLYAGGIERGIFPAYCHPKAKEIAV